MSTFPIAPAHLLKNAEPMGVYDTLAKFHKISKLKMGSKGTHPWLQGSPLDIPVPGGPQLPNYVSFTSDDLKYPSGTGSIELLEAICNYYNSEYGSDITTDNVCVFAGGKPAIFAILSLIKENMKILVEEVEYTQYWHALKFLNIDVEIIPSNEENRFRPCIMDYQKVASKHQNVGSFILKSNPGNPTGVTLTGQKLKELIDFASTFGKGALIDEAYEFYNNPAESALKYIRNINDTNIFICNGATKGLQAPGARIAWVVASKSNINICRNYSSIAMGGVSKISQIFVTSLLQMDRVRQAKQALQEHYDRQRLRYGKALTRLGCTLYSGNGGFYHWFKLPGDLTADEFNNRLFLHDAAILPGSLCDSLRRGDASPFKQFVRFSFGPLQLDSYEKDIEILQKCM